MKIQKLGILVLIIFMVSACLDVETHIKLNYDGSGTIEQTVMMQDEFIGFLSSTNAVNDHNGTDFIFTTEEDIKNASFNFGNNVEFMSLEEVSMNNFTGYKAVYKFADVNDIGINQNPGEAITVNANQQKPPLDELIKFNYKKGHLEIYFPDEKDFLPGETGNTTKSNELDMDDQESLEMIKQLYENMKLGIYISFNGKIKKTNANYKFGNTITLMELEFDKFMSDFSILEKLNNENIESIEQMKKIVSEIPGIKVELENMIFIDFQK